MIWKNYNRYIRFSSIFGIDRYFFLGKPLIFYSDAEWTVEKRYTNSLTRKQGICKVADVIEDILNIPQDTLYNTIFLHRLRYVPNLRYHCDDTLVEMKSETVKTSIENSSEKSHSRMDSPCVLEKICSSLLWSPLFSIECNYMATLSHIKLPSRSIA